MKSQTKFTWVRKTLLGRKFDVLEMEGTETKFAVIQILRTTILVRKFNQTRFTPYPLPELENIKSQILNVLTNENN